MAPIVCVFHSVVFLGACTLLFPFFLPLFFSFFFFFLFSLFLISALILPAPLAESEISRAKDQVGLQAARAQIKITRKMFSNRDGCGDPGKRVCFHAVNPSLPPTDELRGVLTDGGLSSQLMFALHTLPKMVRGGS